MIHVDLTWDDVSRTYAVFVDGRAQNESHGGFDPARKAWYPDQRARINQELGEKGQAGLFDAQPLGSLLSRVTTVRLGNSEVRDQALKRPRSLLRNALLDNFAVFVEEIPPPGRANQAPVIASVDHDAARVAGFSGKLVAGDTLRVSMEGTPGASGTFSIAHYPDFDRRILLDWRGWGVYLEEKTFYEKGEVNLRDVEGYRVYVGTAPFDPLTAGLAPVQELEVGEQSHLLENLEIDTPYYAAVVAVMRDGTLRSVLAPIVDLPLVETEPGVYSGTWTAGYPDRYARAAVVGRLGSGASAATMVGTKAFAVDPALLIEVVTSPSVLKADERSTAKVTVTVTDANGNPVSRHKVKFVLATTSQYTGVVGGGAFADQVGGAVQESAFGQTDLFGRLTVTYVAGFAAKTAIIVARDMLSNDTGAGFVKSFLQATAQLELEPVAKTAAMDAGYEIVVTSSDEWLTADGRSQARITARVALAGQPVEGHKVNFAISGGTGSVRSVKDTTDKSGEARAVYTAGRTVGTVLVTATDATVGISGSVPIELRSDAPAKIAVTVDPEKLPADGSSRAEVRVLVTDINDNPNDNVEVEYLLASGSGRIRDDRGVTDRHGESASVYTAGSSAGIVTFEITVRSPVPTEAETAKARGLALSVTDFKFFQGTAR
jgi:hypothetical protein